MIALRKMFTRGTLLLIAAVMLLSVIFTVFSQTQSASAITFTDTTMNKAKQFSVLAAMYNYDGDFGRINSGDDGLTISGDDVNNCKFFSGGKNIAVGEHVVGGGNWNGGNTQSREAIQSVINSMGKQGCAAFITSVLGYTFNSGNNTYTAPAGIDRRGKLQAFADSLGLGGPLDTMPNYMRYAIVFSGFKTKCEVTGGTVVYKANATGDTPDDRQSRDVDEGNKNDNYKIYTIDNGKPDWYIYHYNGSQSGTQVNLGRGVAIGEGTNGNNLECEDLAKLLQEHKEWADAFITHVGTLPPDEQDQVKQPGSAPTGETDPCDVFGTWALRWLACPILNAVAGVTEFLNGLIENLLTYDVDERMASGGELHKAWQTFRGIALSLLVVTALVMVVSQAAGFDFMDAYTIKKVLPRLLIAIIGMTLSWELLKFVIQFFNDIGGAAYNIIGSAFGTAGSGNANGSFADIIGPYVVGGGAVVAAGVAVTTFPAWGPVLLSLLTTGVVALVIGLAVLALRYGIISMAIIIAPLAIAAYVLPGTKKLWDFWQNTLLTALLMFPIVMGFLALGKGMSYVIGGDGSENGAMQILAILVWLLPYLMLPFAFKLAGGLMKTIFSIADDKSRGVFDKQKNFRQDRRKAIHEEQIAGKRGGVMAGFRQRSNAARHGHRSWGAEYGTHRQLMAHQLSSKAAQDDASWSGGDDRGTKALSDTSVRSRSDFIRKYVADGGTHEQAERSADRFEASLGQIGTSATRLAAFKARNQSNTAYEHGEAGYRQAVKEARKLMDSDGLSSADAAAILKSNRNRGDYAGVGFGDWMSTLDGASIDQNGNASFASGLDSKFLANAALQGSRPGDIVGGHKNAVKSVTGTMVDNLQAAHSSGNHVATMQELAKIAGRYDAMAQVAPQNAEVMAKEVLSVQMASAPNRMQVQMGADGKPVKDANGQVVMQDTGQKMTIREMIEANRGNADFLDMRREYGSSAAAQAAQQGMPPVDPAAQQGP